MSKARKPSEHKPTALTDVAEAAREYTGAELGLALVQWSGEKSKGPREEGWNNPESAVRLAAHIKPNIHGIGIAHLYSRTCALDIDNLDLARKYHDALGIDLIKLLSTGVRISSGRPGRAKLIYSLPDDVTAADFHTINDQANGFEYRCATKNGKTVQDVLPPTIHPDTGNPYVWKGPDDRPDPWRYIPMAPTALLEHWYARLKESRSVKYNDKYNDMLEPIISDALMTIDPDISYGDWLAIGMALSLVGLGELWDDWSSSGKKYHSEDCEGRLLGFQHRGENLVTIGTIFHHARAAGWTASGLWTAQCQWVLENVTDYREVIERVAHLASSCQPSKGEEDQTLTKLKGTFRIPKATIKIDLGAASRELRAAGGEAGTAETFTDHREIAIDYVARRYKPAADGSKRITSTGHNVWNWNHYWQAIPDEKLVQDVQNDYSKQPLCTHHSQVKQVAEAILTHLWEPDFFKDAPPGIATPGGFYFIHDGELRHEENSPKHRQLAFTPVSPAAGAMKQFSDNLKRFLGHDHAQLDLAQELAGAVLFRQMYRYKQAILLYGKSRTGKSTFTHTLEAMFAGGGKITHMAPNKMQEDYWRAALDGSVLNACMELPDGKDIASEQFKMIVEGEATDARDIRQKVITLRCQSSHIFSTNYIPTTTLTDESWYNRFRVLEFRNPLSAEELNYNFEAGIAAELPAIMFWAIEGMRRLLHKGRFTVTTSHVQFIAQWQRANNQVLQFLADGEWVTRDSKKRTPRSEAYRVYDMWCRRHERKVMPKSAFNNEMASHFPLKDISKVGDCWDGLTMAIPAVPQDEDQSTEADAKKVGPQW